MFQVLTHEYLEHRKQLDAQFKNQQNKTMQTQENKPYSPIADESSYNRETKDCNIKEIKPQISDCCNSSTEKMLNGVDYLKFTILNLKESARRGAELEKASIVRSTQLQALLDSLPSKLNYEANQGLIYLLKINKI